MIDPNHGDTITAQSKKNPSHLRVAIFVASLCFIGWGWVAKSAADETSSLLPANVQAVIANHCLDCHNAETSEGEVRLDNVDKIEHASRLELFNRVQDQLFFHLMPPPEADQPGKAEGTLLAGWVRSELRKHNASKLDEKLRHPAFGNFVDHEQLFAGDATEKAFTPARRWLVSPQIFIERVNGVFQLTGSARQKKFYGVTNPIVLPDHAGIRYYDTTALDGGHLLIMLNNAQWISGKQVFAAVHAGENRRDLKFANAKDNWVPPSSPAAFVTIAKKTSPPTEAEMLAAIEAQFACVLQRPPTAAELKESLALLQSTIELGGNAEGLRQMLIAVLLKSEFLYRLEFGAGEPDEFGRKKLSPHEASFAIAYAISDRGPDDELLAAAKDGRLLSKEDYQREVLRLLNDKKTYFAEGAPTVNGIHLRSHKVTHPKINRFFREFFGYPNSIKVFKDASRSGAWFLNADRGYTGTAGSVTNEADRVVDRILVADTNVFEELLTTDEYFVIHPKSNSEGQKIVQAWRAAYDGLKDLDWKNDAEAALLANFEDRKDLFKAIRIDHVKADRLHVHVRDFKRFMQLFENTFGNGLTPITNPWFYHGGQKYRYSEIYSLPPVPGEGRLDLSDGKPANEKVWDYPIAQPFQVPHRKGILTHPAWLLAHSQNTETDPVRRGRWIREKLLAGQVPDVPITVDAQIPEDHHRTLRERLDSVTGKRECWKCHEQMNPLGLTFEIFDDFGRFRTDESLEHPDNIIKKGIPKKSVTIYKTKPVDASGFLSGTGDPSLDGEVKDAFDLIDRLAKSERVRQSIIRHAFRYFMGRNEMLSDSETLIAADEAYVTSGGSFQAVIVSLLTSDSFRYRKEIP